MDFELTDDQELLRDAVRRFVAERCPPETAKRWDEEARAPQDLLEEMAEMGWFQLPYPEDVGGLDGSALDLVILAEELGRASFDVAMTYVANVVGGLSVLTWCASEQRDELFPDVLAGRRRFAIGISEPAAGSDVAALRTRAEERGDHFVVNGQKLWCTGAGLPDTSIILYVRTDLDAEPREGMSVLLVDPEAEGVELRLIPTLARHILGTYEVFLHDVRVPRSNLIGELDGGWQVLLSGLERERVLISGGYVGAAQSTIDEAVRYGSEREQFGQPVATFQALAHQLADLQTKVDAARLLTYRAASRVDKGQRSLREGSMAKLFGSETYVEAARWSMQVHGGFGFSTESMASFRYRESIVATISGGTSQIQRNIIASTMGIRPR